jgi:putative ABC transport system permease protein
LRDLAGEALDGAGAKVSRLVIGVLGTAVGIAALVLTTGLGQTAAGQVSAHFDASAASHVEIRPATHRGADGDDHASAPLPADSVDRIRRLAGVRAAVLLSGVDPAAAPVHALAVVDPREPPTVSPPVIAVRGDLEKSAGTRVAHGRFFDAGHDRRGDRVVVLGAEAAEALGVTGVESMPAVFIAGRAFTVIGILTSSEADPSLLPAVLVPYETARRDLVAVDDGRMLVSVARGAGAQVARQAPIALDPNDPTTFTAGAPTAPPTLQNAVASDLDQVFVAIALVTLLAGTFGIAGVAMLSVSQRTAEIGLRRALGATRSQIAAQFMLESVIVGLLGGTTGAAIGVLGVVIVALQQSWTPVLDVGTALLGALVGGAVGLLAGGYPALAAGRIEPAAALRDGA